MTSICTAFIVVTVKTIGLTFRTLCKNLIQWIRSINRLGDAELTIDRVTTRTASCVSPATGLLEPRIATFNHTIPILFWNIIDAKILTRETVDLDSQEEPLFLIIQTAMNTITSNFDSIVSVLLKRLI